MEGITRWMPSGSAHPAFGKALREAAQNGVKLLALNCIVKEDEIIADRQVEIIL